MRRHGKYVKKEYETLQFGEVKDGMVKLKVEAEFEVHIDYLIENGHLVLKEEETNVPRLIFNAVCRTMFDDSWGRLTASKVKLKTSQVSDELKETFSKYYTRYFETKKGIEKIEKAKEVQELEERLKELKKA